MIGVADCNIRSITHPNIQLSTIPCTYKSLSSELLNCKVTDTLHHVPKKHVTTFSIITLTISLCVIERGFHFPSHLSSASATTLPWEITEHKK